MVNLSRRVTLKDSTLREGLDTPGVSFSVAQKLRIAKALDEAGVPEIEIVAPSRVMQDVHFAGILKAEKLQLRTSGLVYAYHPRWQVDVEAAAAGLGASSCGRGSRGKPSASADWSAGYHSPHPAGDWRPGSAG